MDKNGWMKMGILYWLCFLMVMYSVVFTHMESHRIEAKLDEVIEILKEEPTNGES